MRDSDVEKAVARDDSSRFMRSNRVDEIARPPETTRPTVKDEVFRICKRLGIH